jgi:hypothetical protein
MKMAREGKRWVGGALILKMGALSVLACGKTETDEGGSSPGGDGTGGEGIAASDCQHPLEDFCIRENGWGEEGDCISNFDEALTYAERFHSGGLGCPGGVDGWGPIAYRYGTCGGKPFVFMDRSIDGYVLYFDDGGALSGIAVSGDGVGCEDGGPIRFGKCDKMKTGGIDGHGGGIGKVTHTPYDSSMSFVFKSRSASIFRSNPGPISFLRSLTVVK